MGAGDQLMELYDATGSEEVREQIAQTMFMTGNHRALIRIARNDDSEEVRQAAVRSLGLVGSREALEAQHGQVWSTEELQQDFEALGFMAPFIVVRRRSDGA